MMLTPHFSLEELIRSDVAVRKGIANLPDEQIIENLKILALGLERIRAILGVPMQITSGYRSPKLNSAVGGSKNSAHMQGFAADFIAPRFGDPKDVCAEIMAHGAEINFDQLINEGKWVHIGFAEEPRHQVLTAHFSHGGVTYSRGLV